MTPEPPPQEELSLPLRTPRLILRDFRDEDFDDIHAYGSDPEVCRYMPWGPNTLEDTAQALARMQAQARAWPRMELGLGIELVQPYVGRSREWIDVVADLAGLLAGTGLGLMLRRFLKTGPYKDW